MINKEIIIVLFCIISFLLSSCNKKEITFVQSERTIGRYIYEDDNDVYHIDSYCIRLRRGKDENGHEIYGKHPIDTAEFVIVDKRYVRVCTRCVDDKSYEHLIRLSNRNSRKNERR